MNLNLLAFVLTANALIGSAAHAATQSSAQFTMSTPVYTSSTPGDAGVNPFENGLDYNGYSYLVELEDSTHYYYPYNGRDKPFRPFSTTHVGSNFNQVSGSTSLGVGAMSGTVSAIESSDFEWGKVNIHWSRYFELAPHTCVTFIGVPSITAQFDMPQTYVARL